MLINIKCQNKKKKKKVFSYLKFRTPAHVTPYDRYIEISKKKKKKKKKKKEL